MYLPHYSGSEVFLGTLKEVREIFYDIPKNKMINELIYYISYDPNYTYEQKIENAKAVYYTLKSEDITAAEKAQDILNFLGCHEEADIIDTTCKCIDVAKYTYEWLCPENEENRKRRKQIADMIKLERQSIIKKYRIICLVIIIITVILLLFF